MLINLAWRSLWSRRSTVGLITLAMALSLALVMAVNLVQKQARVSFSSTVSGTDLIIGPRTGPINLLLYSIFRVGNATANISETTLHKLADDERVAWVIPLSLGDSHRGYRVLATDHRYFEHYQYGDSRSLAFAEGRAFDHAEDAVLGAEVARRLGYRLGDTLIVAHGLSDVTFSRHQKKPFVVAGILLATGTPVDRTVHVSLAGMEAIHHGDHHPGAGAHVDVEGGLTAVLVGLKERSDALLMQRQLNADDQEPLLAIMPGVTLSELWQVTGVMENLLRVLSALILVVSLIGMVAMLMVSVGERRREIAILRMLGAHPLSIFLLIELEVLLLTLISLGLAFGLLGAGLYWGADSLAERWGLVVQVSLFDQLTVLLSLSAIALALLFGLLPAVQAYRRSLHQGMLVTH